MEFLIVGVGGFFGAIARYLVYLAERAIPTHVFPFGTLFINLFGCFLAGGLLALVERAAPVNRHLILLASMGFVSSFTTFSTLSVETLQLIRSGQVIFAATSVGANLTFGIASVWLGRYLLTDVLRWA